MAVPTAHANDEWRFVWVGATAEGWTVVRGRAQGSLKDKEIHFDLVGENGVKYILDAQRKDDGSVEAGFAAAGSQYAGITILAGKIVRESLNLTRNCKVEVLQLQNNFNSISVGNFRELDCKNTK